MKVNTNAPSHPGVTVEKAKANEAQGKAGAPKEGSTRAPEAASHSSVEISENAKLLQKANEIVHSMPDVRSEKVESLKRRIQDGTYQVDAAAVADRLLDEHIGTDFGKNNI